MFKGGENTCKNCLQGFALIASNPLSANTRLPDAFKVANCFRDKLWRGMRAVTPKLYAHG
jgi:hypothetical protein